MQSEPMCVRFVEGPPCERLLQAARDEFRRLSQRLSAPLHVVVIVSRVGADAVRIRVLGALHCLAFEGRGEGHPQLALQDAFERLARAAGVAEPLVA